MKKHSAGLIVYKMQDGLPLVLMAHMGAPWWAKKDIGAWTIPKGEIEDGEDPLQTAKREFTEELGLQPPVDGYVSLGSIEQNNNKTVTAWAVEGSYDVSQVHSNTFKAEWPPRSGKTQDFPEVDRAAWLTLAEASQKCVSGQAELFGRLANNLKVPFGTEEIPEPPQQGMLF